ncbi:MAG: hypothetical protein IIY87_00255 [Bacteroidales bacterium]|nr:hypothetical protein [Bacteroidales bacterium]
MRKITIAGVCLLFALLASSCAKERTCRCSVRGEQYVRVFKIEDGTCEQIRYVLYDLHAVISHDLTDSVLCTDYYSDSIQ